MIICRCCEEKEVDETQEQESGLCADCLADPASFCGLGQLTIDSLGESTDEKK